MRKSILTFMLLFLSLQAFAMMITPDEEVRIRDLLNRLESIEQLSQIQVDCENPKNTEDKYAIGKCEIKTGDGKKIQISEITLEHLSELFKKMANDKKIPFRFPEDGCYARAHKMSLLLEEMGVKTGKIFLEGNLRVETKNSPKGYVSWWYHVAPVINVKNKGDKKGSLYVIDPSLFDKPVPLQDWIDIQTKHKKGRKDKQYKTARFQYYPGITKKQKSDWDKNQVKSMKSTLESYSRIVKNRDKSRLETERHQAKVREEKRKKAMELAIEISNAKKKTGSKK